MSWIWIVLAVLAVYRAAHMIALEEGPFGLFARLQAATARQANWFQRGVNCVLCLSFWLSAPAALLLQWHTWQEYVLLWLGIAGAVVVLQKLLARR